MVNEEQLEILKQGVEEWNDRGGAGWICLKTGLDPGVERMICLALTLRIREDPFLKFSKPG